MQIELSEKIHLLTKTEQKNKELQRYEGDLLKCLEERGALEAAAEETDNSTLTRPQLVAALTNLTRQLTQLREELWLANSAKTQLGRTIVHLREQVSKHCSNCCKIWQNYIISKRYFDHLQVESYNQYDAKMAEKTYDNAVANNATSSNIHHSSSNSTSVPQIKPKT